MRDGRRRLERIAITAVIAGWIGPTVARMVRRAGAARRAVDLRMSVVVERPITEVFEFSHDFENFPEITDELLSVEDSQDGRSHWVVRSPTGRTIEWDAIVTKYVPNAVIAWESVPGSSVESTGLMRFAPVSPGQTRVDITLTYLPLHTTLAEAIRAIFRSTSAQRLRSEVASASRTLNRR